MAPNLYSKISTERIKELIESQCGGSQQNFADRTGLNKASVSQYVHGKSAPNNITAAAIAEQFHVNPAWVMGFDAPKYGGSGSIEDNQRRDYLFTKYGALMSDLDGMSEDDLKEVENFIKFKTSQSDS